MIPPVVVTGSSGGAGATTMAWGLSSAAAHDSGGQIFAVAVDATLGGGDLADRGCDAQVSSDTVQSWLRSEVPSLASVVRACTGATSTGARILGRAIEPLPPEQTLTSVHRYLSDAGAVPIYDAGSPVGNREIAPMLADPRFGLVIAVAARADAVNRLKATLGWLERRYGEFVVGDGVLALCHQEPDRGSAAADHVRGHLGAWFRAVAEVPYDAHLGAGGRLSWEELAAGTRAAYQQLWWLLR
ncbi:MinD/ParA family ATP-binding protein [Nocardia takedensis]|uniref:MinD/ParA family ATP-binding protein n=1 Tax=Nocardia takedensis TaxID=259390 RepID=UPI003F76387A